jgi:hypothetical protein
MQKRAYAIRDWNPVERSFWIIASTAQPVRGFEVDEKGQTVEYWEALRGWDLSRFDTNPLILDSHKSEDIESAIGLASDYVQTPEGGLQMKVTLAAVSDAPRSAVFEKKIKAGLVRGVSVGFDFGKRTDEVIDGKQVRVYTNNQLSEVSLCLIPKDEGALLVQRVDEDPDADPDTDTVVRTDFIGSISKFERTQVGGLRVPARVTRTGVLIYKNPRTGAVRRELRLPEEVFHADSLASLSGATVTDLAHHKGLLGVHDWKDATLGHAEAVRRDGKYVEVDLVINEPAAIADIENRRLHDISCGYACKLDATPGVYEGEPYDVIQRRIRYNHVAVLPKGKGRAGTDVALRLDAKDADECVETPDPENERTDTMAEPQTKTVIRIDGKDIEYGSAAHITILESAHLADLAKFETKEKELVARCDAAEGKAKDAEKRAEKAEGDLKEEKDGEEAKKRRRTRERLLRRAIRALTTEEEDEDEEKMDALDEELCELSNLQLMLKVIRTDAQYADDKTLDDKPEPYIQAIFDGLTKRGVTRNDGIDSVVKSVERVKRKDSGFSDPAAENRKKMNATAQAAWKQPIS